MIKKIILLMVISLVIFSCRIPREPQLPEGPHECKCELGTHPTEMVVHLSQDKVWTVTIWEPWTFTTFHEVKLYQDKNEIDAGTTGRYVGIDPEKRPNDKFEFELRHPDAKCKHGGC